MTPEEFARTNAGVGILRHELKRHLQQIELGGQELKGSQDHIAAIEEKIVRCRRKIAEHESAVVDIRTVLSSLGVLATIDLEDKEES